jgi:L-iditol 2-dehydrogenase
MVIEDGDMKALVLTRYNEFEYQDVPIPRIGPQEVLIEVKACGICGSDVHGMDGSTGRRRPPIIMGHEAAGVIAEVGSAVRGWKKGNRVTFDSTIYCGRCEYCLRGQVNLCDRRRVLGVSCQEYRQDGALAEFVSVPQHILCRLPEGLSFERAAMVEPLSVAVHAAGRIPVVPDGKVAVFGAGIIGLLSIQALRQAGWRNVIAIDIDQDKLELARTLGAAHTFNASVCDPVEQVLAVANGAGVEAALEAVGIESVFQAACRCLRKGGAVTLVGNVSPQVGLPLQLVVTRELALYGSYASSGEYPTCLEMIAQGKVDVDCLISAVAPLAEGNAWFHRLYAREKGLKKVILAP